LGFVTDDLSSVIVVQIVDQHTTFQFDNDVKELFSAEFSEYTLIRIVQSAVVRQHSAEESAAAVSRQNPLSHCCLSRAPTKVEVFFLKHQRIISEKYVQSTLERNSHGPV
jgi:hypothetical protein